jgi:hypothetical protein
MKTLVAFFTVLVISGSTPSHQKSGDDKYAQLVDYALSYKWDAVKNEWLVPSKVIYFYNEQNIFVQSVALSSVTNDTISRLSYYYNEDGRLVQYSTQIYSSGNWINASKYELTYNDSGNLTSLLLSNWKNGAWVYDRFQHNYVYNPEGQLESFETQRWSGTIWKNIRIEFYYYDNKGKITGSLAKDEFLINTYQVFYYYNEFGKRTGMLVQGWDKNSGSWVDGYRDTYTYNACSLQIGRLRERFIKGQWVNESKDEIIYKSFYDNNQSLKKIPVCHNGHTIYVSKNAVPAHLAHGDCIGECAVEKKPERQTFDEKEKSEKPPFTIYPNPASEKITIKFDKDECKESKKVELTDFYGKLIKSFDIKDNSDLTIYRDNLLSGKYYIRLIGKEVYSGVVIFE